MSGSRSSPRSERRPRSGTGRAQAEPLAAIAALLAVGIGLALFAGASGTVPASSDRSVAGPALERASGELLRDGVVDPATVPDPPSIAPASHEARITVLVAGREHAVGPEPPAEADRASRPVTVRVAPGDQRPGRLVVEVWP